MNGKHLIRTLGLLLLIGAYLMAMSASAAQAKWLLLRNGVSVLELKLDVSVPSGRLLVPGLGLVIQCTTGTANVTASLNAAHTILTGTAAATFTSCTDTEWNETCAVGSPGKANGTITASGNGVGGMAAGEEEYFVDASSSEFSSIEYRGAECPLTEINGKVSGKVRIDLLNALADTTLKAAHILDKGLQAFGEPAVPEGLDLKSLLVSILETTGATWGIHLVGL